MINKNKPTPIYNRGNTKFHNLLNPEKPKWVAINSDGVIRDRARQKMVLTNNLKNLEKQHLEDLKIVEIESVTTKIKNKHLNTN